MPDDCRDLGYIKKQVTTKERLEKQEYSVSLISCRTRKRLSCHNLYFRQQFLSNASPDAFIHPVREENLLPTGSTPDHRIN